jgi:hypothetical protein
MCALRAASLPFCIDGTSAAAAAQSATIAAPAYRCGPGNSLPVQATAPLCQHLVAMLRPNCPSAWIPPVRLPLPTARLLPRPPATCFFSQLQPWQHLACQAKVLAFQCSIGVLPSHDFAVSFLSPKHAGSAICLSK